MSLNLTPNSKLKGQGCPSTYDHHTANSIPTLAHRVDLGPISTLHEKFSFDTILKSLDLTPKM